MRDYAGTFTTDQQVFDALDIYLTHHYERLPVNFISANGVWLYADQRKVLDMMAQYSAAGFGRGYKKSCPFFTKVVDALMNELARGCGVLPGSCANETVAEGARAICEFTGTDKVLFMNTGSEAFDTVVKIIRKWAYVVRGISENRGIILVCGNNFHGRTLGAISASDTEQYKEGFGPLLPGFGFVEFGNAGTLEKAFTQAPIIWGRKVLAFLTEPVQAEGGINVPPDGYLRKAKEICRKYNALFVLDEVQTGFGRTGFNFDWEHDGDGSKAKPDLMMLGKMLGGGAYPVSAVVGCGDVMRVFGPGDHGSTFGGTPLACAVVKKVVEIFQEHPEVIINAHRMGQYFKTRLIEIMKRSRNPFLKEVRGRGLLLGIKFKERLAEHFQAELLGENVLAGVAGHGYVLRFSPALIITEEEIDWALPRIEKILKVKF